MSNFRFDKSFLKFNVIEIKISNPICLRCHCQDQVGSHPNYAWATQHSTANNQEIQHSTFPNNQKGIKEQKFSVTPTNWLPRFGEKRREGENEIGRNRRRREMAGGRHRRHSTPCLLHASRSGTIISHPITFLSQNPNSPPSCPISHFNFRRTPTISETPSNSRPWCCRSSEPLGFRLTNTTISVSSHVLRPIPNLWPDPSFDLDSWF